MIDWNKPLRTHGGCPARLLGIIKPLPDSLETHAVAITLRERVYPSRRTVEYEEISMYNPSGTWLRDGTPSSFDLINTNEPVQDAFQF